MKLRKLLFVIGLLFPATVFASEAIVYAAVYECNADEVNQALVETCSDSYPELFTAASEAMREWRGRNSAKARLAKESCEVELRAKETGTTQTEMNAIRSQMSNIKSEIRRNFYAQLQSDGKGVCIEALHHLASGSGAMDFK